MILNSRITLAIASFAAVCVSAAAVAPTQAQQAPAQQGPIQQRSVRGAAPNQANAPSVRRTPVRTAQAGQVQRAPRVTDGLKPQGAVPQNPAGQRAVSPNQLQRQMNQRQVIQGQPPKQLQRAGQQRNLMVKAAPFKLTPAEKKRVDDLLGFWEFSSGKVQTYTTKFERLEFDPVFGPKDPRTPRTRGFGVIRYSAPDKGEFKLETIGEYTPPKKAGANTYPQKPVQFDEHWICDGKSVYEFNTKTKQLIETKLPPEMQGKRIADGPLPFMFGAKKAELLERYWIREIKNAKPGQYVLDIYPKRREDALNYSRVSVIIAEDDFLPMALQIFPPNFDRKLNPAKTVYAFKDRQTNKPLHRTQQFFNRFVSPKPPIGWKKVVSNVGQPVPPANVQLAPRPRAATPQAVKPQAAQVRGPQPRATATRPRAAVSSGQPTGKASR